MFVHLHTHSPYSFLDGGTPIEHLVHRAASLGMTAMALTDHDNVCAAVKFTRACEAYQIQPILGAELTLEDDTHLTLLAKNRIGYANLCSLLTLAHTHGGRLNAHLPWSVLPDFTQGIFCLSGCPQGRVSRAVQKRHYSDALSFGTQLRDWFGQNSFAIEIQDDFRPGSLRVCRELVQLAKHLNVAAVATNNVHFAVPDDFIAHDLLRCVSAGITVQDAHAARPLNAERYLKSEQEMSAIFQWAPQALEATLRIAEQCTPALPANEEITPLFRGGNAPAILRTFADQGARDRYKRIIPKVRQRLDEELSLICQLGYADYFLMVRDVVVWARANGIRCTGRGSAADSCVAYCLYLTDVDVIQRNLPFARFLVPGKMPDIDMDFPSDRRDEVFQYIIRTYGEGYAGMVCTFHTYYAKGAIRDLGKALILPPDTLQFLSRHVSGFVRAHEAAEAFESYAELKPHRGLLERFKLLFDLCKRISGFPRHLGTHSSGMVISRVPLTTIAPLQPSARGLTQIWTLDKDDAEEIGAIKFDILGLRMLSAVADAETDIAKTDSAFQYDRIPFDDTQTYNMMQAGKAVGTFQFESPAQLSLATKLLPTEFEDLVASVALIRPGPIRGHVVGRFVASRNGWARADVLHWALHDVLAKTFGCIVFQEQVVQAVAIMTGSTDAEGDKFRKRITLHAKRGTIDEARDEFVTKACAYHRDFRPQSAHALFDQIEGWSGYGFTEGHAASFALTGYRTAFLSFHHAAEYFSGMMNQQPMGFYNANSLGAEARRRGVSILPVDINISHDKCCAEDKDIRLGFRLISDMNADDIIAIEKARERGPFTSLLDFCIRVPMHRDRLENMILSGAFDRLHSNRRALLFVLDAILRVALPCRAANAAPAGTELHLQHRPTMPPCDDIPDFNEWERFVWTWRVVGVTAECHVFAYFREQLAERGFITAYEAQQRPHGEKVWVAGLNIRPHRPHTASGKPVLFASLEDETELLQLGCFGKVIEDYTSVFLCGHALMVEGLVQRRGRGSSLNVTRAKPFDAAQYLGPAPRIGPVMQGAWRMAPGGANKHPQRGIQTTSSQYQKKP